MPSALQVHAALEVLSSAGWRLTPPVVSRLQMLTVGEVAEVLGVHVDTARRIVLEIPGTVRLPGGDIRVRAASLERWLEQHPAKPAT